MSEIMHRSYSLETISGLAYGMSYPVLIKIYVPRSLSRCMIIKNVLEHNWSSNTQERYAVLDLDFLVLFIINWGTFRSGKFTR